MPPPPPPPSKRGRPGSKPAENAKSNERNEYIPSFIAKKPFYIDDATASDSDYLEHQRLQSQKNHDPLATSTWYDRGRSTSGPAATKYRKGACANCGSLSHTEKDCLQRKRKHGARWTGRDIAADETVKEVNLGWAAKRDRWNGYNAEDYQQVVDEFNELEAMKKRTLDPQDGANDAPQPDDTDPDPSASEDAKYEEETDMGRTQATSTRNLRLREDTAKYLLNLDPESAKYDPKTRTMADAKDDAAALEADEGFARPADDAAEFERAQTYAWETQERGDRDRIHMQANPTEALLKRKRKAEEDAQKSAATKKALLDKYGSQETVSKPAKGLVGTGVTSSERFVEYDERGRVKGEVRKKEKSMYAEDVRVQNHTAAWGSWWKEFKWGYACCHSTVKNSYCTGEKGKRIAEEADYVGKGLLPSAEESGNAEEVSRDEAWKEEERNEEHVPNAVDPPAKSNMDDSRRRLDELKSGITDAEMEKYHKERLAKNDPMAKMLGRDELVDV